MAPVARYKQIAAILRARIESGDLEPGQTVPSEPTLMQEFGVARNTVRHAIEVLRQAGLVTTVPGMGTYVSKPDAGA